MQSPKKKMSKRQKFLEMIKKKKKKKMGSKGFQPNKGRSSGGY